MNSAIDEAEAASGRPPAKPAPRKPTAAAPGGKAARSERDVRREIGNLERTIAKLDAEKRAAHEALLTTTDPAEALRLHTAMTAAAEKLSAAEERWLALQEEAGEG
jgi:ATP-binding cassette subfamily F protein 3